MNVITLNGVPYNHLLHVSKMLPPPPQHTCKMYETLVNIGNRVYWQCVGIPMGTDCAPLLANLFLF